ncbi:MAG: hypothetical protein LBD22_05135 [Spirochaetaceae bacterium]|jgi:hypothetical protein|nr:hypothetical protein [Spirochaetaceae bacterium]
MSWTQKMKEILSQGLQTSAGLAERAGTAVGVAAAELGSKTIELSGQAVAKMQDLGERGAMTLENKALEGRLEKLCTKLGLEVYSCLFESKLDAVGRQTPEITATLDEITAIRQKIEANEAAINNSAASDH